MFQDEFIARYYYDAYTAVWWLVSRNELKVIEPYTALTHPNREASQSDGWYNLQGVQPPTVTIRPWPDPSTSRCS